MVCDRASAWAIFIALFAALPALACENAASLKSSRHLELGVRFSTHDQRIIQQTSYALKRWSEIADMAWHRDETDACSIDVEESKSIAADEIAEANATNGSIIFASAAGLTANELFITAFHEIGHLLGLQHNPNPRSVMYWIDIRGDEVLDKLDMHNLATAHALRPACSDEEICEILPHVSPVRSAANETRTSRTSVVALRRASFRPTAKRSRRHRRHPTRRINAKA